MRRPARSGPAAADRGPRSGRPGRERPRVDGPMAMPGHSRLDPPEAWPRQRPASSRWWSRASRLLRARPGGRPRPARSCRPAPRRAGAARGAPREARGGPHFGREALRARPASDRSAWTHAGVQDRARRLPARRDGSGVPCMPSTARCGRRTAARPRTSCPFGSREAEYPGAQAAPAPPGKAHRGPTPATPQTSAIFRQVLTGRRRQITARRRGAASPRRRSRPRP